MRRGGEQASPLLTVALAILLSLPPLLSARAEGDGLWDRPTLSGDWGGLRGKLEAGGLQITGTHIGDVLGNPVGGLRGGTTYEGRIELGATADLATLMGWTGATVHANAYLLQGRGLSGNYVGNILTVSNIEAERGQKLYDLWFQQEMLESQLSIRAGQIAADDEFFVSQYAGTFINSTFGWPAILGANLPSGGPVFPLATPGLRVKGALSPAFSLQAAVFSGDPAGTGVGTPQSRDPAGLAFRFGPDAFLMLEGGYAVNQEQDAPGLPLSLKLGAWYHTGRFADQRFDASGRSLADPASSGIAASRGGDSGLYFVADRMIWRNEGGDRSLATFLRLGGAPQDRNLIGYYADAGISYHGVRQNDVVGLAVSYGRISDAARALDRDTLRFIGVDQSERDYEAVVELTYQAQLAPWWTLQPDLQFVLHPGAHGANPTDPTGRTPIRNALVLGLRTAVTF